MVKILQKEDPALRKVSEPVSIDELKQESFAQLLADMRVALNSQDDAVAVAAPQIGVHKRVFMVSGRIFDNFEERITPHKDIVFVNPEILKLSKDHKLMTEGCLSVRWLYGKIRRASRATVKAMDENGEEFERGASGLLAQIFQHEIDHLNGILFIDNARDLEDIPPEKQTKPKKKTSHA